MYEKFFAERLSALRNQKKVSAREMSLEIGQNESYINRIENGHTFPSMQGFFYICEYLNITPCEFFDEKISNPIGINDLILEFQKLDESQMNIVISVVRGLQKKN